MNWIPIKISQLFKGIRMGIEPRPKTSNSKKFETIVPKHYLWYPLQESGASHQADVKSQGVCGN